MKNDLIKYLRRPVVTGKKEIVSETGEKYTVDSVVNVPYAVLVAVNDNGVLSFGYSLCHRNDEFQKKRGKAIAKQRALNVITKDSNMSIPASIYDEFRKFVGRGSAFFRSTDIHPLFTPVLKEANLLHFGE